MLKESSTHQLSRCKLKDHAQPHAPVVGVLVEADPCWRRRYERTLGVADDGELVSLLEEPGATLAEGDLKGRGGKGRDQSTRRRDKEERGRLRREWWLQLVDALVDGRKRANA